jgi:hypothetical protein
MSAVSGAITPETADKGPPPVALRRRRRSRILIPFPCEALEHRDEPLPRPPLGDAELGQRAAADTFLVIEQAEQQVLGTDVVVSEQQGFPQQDGAGRMIDDEPGDLAQALRAEPGLVAVPRHDQQIRIRRGCHHDPFGSTLNFQPFIAAPEPVRGRLEQVAGRGDGHLLQPGPRVVPGPMTPPEQARVGAARHVRRVGRRDVQQRLRSRPRGPGPAVRPRAA